MHGLGNDFVFLDARPQPLSLSPARLQALACRRRGIGCDQVAVLEPPQNPAARVFVRFFNRDGSEAGACGNASRCAARLMHEESREPEGFLETRAGLLPYKAHDDGTYTVGMGKARLDWQDIPLAHAADTLRLPLPLPSLPEDLPNDLQGGVAVNVGNPHCVQFVENVAAVPLELWGALVERAPLFPSGVNVEFVQVVNRETLRMRVWERGAGITEACGSGACAAAVAGFLRGFTGRHVTVHLDGGPLEIDYQDDGAVAMRGEARHVFQGTLRLD